MVGIVDGDGAYARGQSAPAGTDDERSEQGQQHKLDEAELPSLSGGGIICVHGAGHDVEFPQQGDDHDGQQHEIPVANKLAPEHVGEVVFVAKFTENARRGAPQGVREVHRVAQVDNQRQRIDDHEHPFAQQMIASALLNPQRKEHQQDVRDIGVGDGRAVEDVATVEQFGQMGQRQVAGEIAVILEKEFHPGDEVCRECHQQVDDHGAERPERSV